VPTGAENAGSDIQDGDGSADTLRRGSNRFDQGLAICLVELNRNGVGMPNVDLRNLPCSRVRIAVSRNCSPARDHRRPQTTGASRRRTPLAIPTEPGACPD
jgi:hypothetical protein